MNWIDFIEQSENLYLSIYLSIYVHVEFLL